MCLDDRKQDAMPSLAFLITTSDNDYDEARGDNWGSVARGGGHSNQIKRCQSESHQFWGLAGNF